MAIDEDTGIADTYPIKYFLQWQCTPHWRRRSCSTIFYAWLELGFSSPYPIVENLGNLFECDKRARVVDRGCRCIRCVSEFLRHTQSSATETALLTLLGEEQHHVCMQYAYDGQRRQIFSANIVRIKPISQTASVTDSNLSFTSSLR